MIHSIELALLRVWVWLRECLSSSHVYCAWFSWICISNHACTRTGRQMHARNTKSTHTLTLHLNKPAHTLELRRRRVWGLTPFRTLRSLDLRYNKLTELPSFPGFSSLRSLVCMVDGVCVSVREWECVCGPQTHSLSLSQCGKVHVCVFYGLALSSGCIVKCVLKCTHTHTHTTYYAQHIMQRAFVCLCFFLQYIFLCVCVSPPPHIHSFTRTITIHAHTHTYIGVSPYL